MIDQTEVTIAEFSRDLITTHMAAEPTSKDHKLPSATSTIGGFTLPETVTPVAGPAFKGLVLDPKPKYAFDPDQVVGQALRCHVGRAQEVIYGSWPTMREYSQLLAAIDRKMLIDATSGPSAITLLPDDDAFGSAVNEPFRWLWDQINGVHHRPIAPTAANVDRILFYANYLSIPFHHVKIYEAWSQLVGQLPPTGGEYEQYLRILTGYNSLIRVVMQLGVDVSKIQGGGALLQVFQGQYLMKYFGPRSPIVPASYMPLNGIFDVSVDGGEQVVEIQQLDASAAPVIAELQLTSQPFHRSTSLVGSAVGEFLTLKTGESYRYYGNHDDVGRLRPTGVWRVIGGDDSKIYSLRCYRSIYLIDPPSHLYAVNDTSLVLLDMKAHGKEGFTFCASLMTNTDGRIECCQPTLDDHARMKGFPYQCVENFPTALPGYTPYTFRLVKPVI